VPGVEPGSAAQLLVFSSKYNEDCCVPHTTPDCFHDLRSAEVDWYWDGVRQIAARDIVGITELKPGSEKKSTSPLLSIVTWTTILETGFMWYYYLVLYAQIFSEFLGPWLPSMRSSLFAPVLVEDLDPKNQVSYTCQLHPYHQVHLWGGRCSTWPPPVHNNQSERWTRPL
jgi:hypothetical protein